MPHLVTAPQSQPGYSNQPRLSVTPTLSMRESIHRFLIPAALLFLGSSALAQGGLHQSYRPGEYTIDVWSGHGALGATDAEVSMLVGPTFGITHPLKAVDFTAAKAGPAAAILLSPTWETQNLQSLPLAKYVAPDQASGLGTSQASALFAIEFEVPTQSIFTATMDFTFVVDDHIGKFGGSGVYINEKPVPGTGITFGGPKPKQFLNKNVARHLRPGTNTMYVYTENPLGFGGLIFHANIRVNPVAPNDCSTALPAYLGSNVGSTNGFTTSPEAAACNVQDDRWYYFVPPISGTMTATVDYKGGAGYTPSLGLFHGSCGALTPLACATAPSPGTDATWSGDVTAGQPILMSVGGTTAGITGNYDLLIDITPNQSALVYPGNGHLYMLTPTMTDIAGARAFAALQGGYLTAINDAAENAWISSKMSASLKVWLGLSDEIVEGIWLWDSGEPFVFSAWNAGEPNDSSTCNGEDHAETLGGGFWNDLTSGPNPCNSGIHYGLVEIPSAGLASVTELGGGCGFGSLQPVLYSEVHVIGSTVDMAVLNAPPNELVLLITSSPAATPTPIGNCVDYIDLATSQIVAGVNTNEYGSVFFSTGVPNDPLLMGVHQVWQAQLPLVVTGALYSNALDMKLGN